MALVVDLPVDMEDNSPVVAEAEAVVGVVEEHTVTKKERNFTPQFCKT